MADIWRTTGKFSICLEQVRYLVSSKHHTQILSPVFLIQILPPATPTDRGYTICTLKKRGIQYLCKRGKNDKKENQRDTN